ncbi:MAG: hypothetical protein VCB26_05500 [Candidatus Hydrogenedentota bacterium]|jgi:hypothetical protein
MMISGGDFDDAIDVIDVWLYVDNPAKEPENGVLPNLQETVFSY